MPTLLATNAADDFARPSELDEADAALPPLPETLRELFACRGEHVVVPHELLNSVRAYRLSGLAAAIERYNGRLTTDGGVAAAM